MQESNKINVLIVGNGGREHALLWAVSKSPILGTLYITNEIYGANKISEIAKLDLDNALSVALFCKQNQIELVIIGPEGYLVNGLVDSLHAEGILVFGPNKIAAQLESSKSFAKDLCKMNGIPTAKYACFSDSASAKKFVRSRGLPVVVKADGLAQGKGVMICKTIREADDAISDMLDGRKFGAAGSTIVIEEFLSGDELSFFALFDGKGVVHLGSACDYKTIIYGDKSYNTGGMGAYSSPEHSDTDALIMKKIIYPTLSSLVSMGIEFRGVLFAGVMITNTGVKLLEYNVRFGDPEIQSIVMRLNSDLLSLMLKTAQGKLHNETVEWNGKYSVCVVMATNGYPIKYNLGSVIRGLDRLDSLKDVTVFHAGTKLKDGNVVANGGRVLNIVACADTLSDARNKAYAAVKLIDWPEGIYVKSIGAR